MSDFGNPNDFPTQGVCVAVTTHSKADQVSRALAAENIRCTIRASVYDGAELWLVEVTRPDQAVAAQQVLGGDPNSAAWSTEAEVSFTPGTEDGDQ